MLNEKALRQAEIALILVGTSASASTKAQAAIEAFIAALPGDEDGLVEQLRAHANLNDISSVDPTVLLKIVDLMRSAAAALEATRVKQRGDVVDLGDLSRSQQRRLTAMAATPKGWQLVPKEMTQEMVDAAGTNSLMFLRRWREVLAAAPEPPG